MAEIIPKSSINQYKKKLNELRELYENAKAAGTYDSKIQSAIERIFKKIDSKLEVKKATTKRVNPQIQVRKIESTDSTWSWTPNRSDKANRSVNIYVGNAVNEWNIKPTAAAQHFALQGIEFGNWVSMKERAEMLNFVTQSLEEIRKILKTDSEAIGFYGRLRMALGSRGGVLGRAAAAHYEPQDFPVVAIYKTQKLGTGHEWAHAFDNMCGIIISGSKVMATGSALSKGTPFDLFQKAIQESGFYDRLNNHFDGLNKKKSRSVNKGYWLSPHEMFARATESWIAASLPESVRKNLHEYLVSSSSAYASRVEWPTLDEQKIINPALAEVYKYGIGLIEQHIGKKTKGKSEKPTEKAKKQKKTKSTVFELEKSVPKVAVIDFKADGSERKEGFYNIIEVNDLLASHSADGTPNTRHSISKGQPRDRSADELKNQPLKMAEKINPEAITEGVSAFSGAPVVNQNLEVIQGNGRAIALKIMYKHVASSEKKYRDFLIKNAAKFGFTKDDVTSFHSPVLVRMIRVDNKEAVRLGNITNTAEAHMSKQDLAKANVRNLSEKEFANIGRIIETAKGETLGEVLDETGFKILRKFENLDTTPFLKKDGNLTEEGKAFLVKVFTTLLFDDSTDKNALKFFNRLPFHIKAGIERAFGSLIALKGTSKDLSPELRKAVEIVTRIAESKDAIATVDQFMKQVDAFEVANNDRFSGSEALLATVLMQAKTQKAVQRTIEQYAVFVNGFESMFETVMPMSKTEAIENLAKRTNPAGWLYFNKLTGLNRAVLSKNAKVDEHSVEFLDEKGNPHGYAFVVPHAKKPVAPWIPAIATEAEIKRVLDQTGKRENPEELVENPLSSGFVFGEITPKVSKSIGREKGQIYLKADQVRDHLTKHAKEMGRSREFIVELAAKAASHPDRIYAASNGGLLLAKTLESPSHFIVIQLERAESWFIRTCTVMRPDYLKNKTLLWERAQSNHSISETPGADSGHKSVQKKDTEVSRENPFYQDSVSKFVKLKRLRLKITGSVAWDESDPGFKKYNGTVHFDHKNYLGFILKDGRISVKNVFGKTIGIFDVSRENPNETVAKSSENSDTTHGADDNRGKTDKNDGMSNAQPQNHLIKLGYCTELETTVGFFKGRDLMVASPELNKIFIIPAHRIKKFGKRVSNKKAESAFKQFNHYEATEPDLIVDIPTNKTPMNAGFGIKILYESDKIMEQGDDKGEMHTYIHEFDLGKRPVKRISDVVVIENLKIDGRGILN